VGVLDGGNTLRSNAKEALGPSTTFRSGISHAGLHVAFCFETIEGGIDGTDGHFPLGACFDLPPDGHSVGLVSKAQDRQKYDVFEFAEVIASRHYVYNIEEMMRLSQERFLASQADHFAAAKREEKVGLLRSGMTGLGIAVLCRS
jgi:hypothetical protein